MKSRVGKKSETLEDGAIVELLRVTDQQFAISRLAPEIVTQAIRHVIDAAPHIRCSDHIDKRARGVRDRDLGGAAPQSFQSEQASRFYIMQQECGALRGHMLQGDTARSKDEGLIEELLGEFPMMSGSPAADVALTKERRDKHPWICDDLFAASQIQGHGNIKPMPDPPEPALLSPARQKLCGFAPLDTESLCRNIDRHDFLGGAEHGSKPRSGSWQRVCVAFHGYIITR